MSKKIQLPMSLNKAKKISVKERFGAEALIY